MVCWKVSNISRKCGTTLAIDALIGDTRQMLLEWDFSARTAMKVEAFMGWDLLWQTPLKAGTVGQKLWGTCFLNNCSKNTGIRSPHPVLNRIGWLSKPQVHPIFFLDALSSDPQPIWLSARHTQAHASSSWWTTENTYTGCKAKLSRHSTIWKKKPHLLFSCTLTALAKP